MKLAILLLTISLTLTACWPFRNDEDRFADYHDICASDCRTDAPVDVQVKTSSFWVQYDCTCKGNE